MISFKEAGREDLPVLLSIYSHLDDDVLDLTEAGKYFDEMMSVPGYRIYLCFQDDVPVGTFSLMIMRNLAHMGAKSGVIEDVVVVKEYRSMGIGREMMRHALNLCRRAGCYKAALSTNLKRERAHEFYENTGFRKHGYSFSMEFE